MFDIFSFTETGYLVEEVDGCTAIHVPMPGVSREDLEIEAAPSLLEIRVTGSKKLPFLVKRRWRFNHRFGTPEVSAKVENGILTLKLNDTSRSKYRVEVS